jgi:hypothetical protein
LVRRVGRRAGPFALAGLGPVLGNPADFGIGHKYAAADLERFDSADFE